MDLFNEPIFPGTELRDMIGGHDSRLWLELFIQAEKIDHDLVSRLMYLRNVGCRLVDDAKFGLVIVPMIDGEHWESRERYDEEKQCLIPFRNEVVNLLRWLSAWKTQNQTSAQ